MLTRDYEPQFGVFHDLMPFRVKDILLVSSFYDAFVLEEDGGLSEQIFNQYVDLNLRFIPRIIRVSSGKEALAEIKKGTYQLVITMTRIPDMELLEFGRRVKELKPNLMVILLTYEWVEIPFLIKSREVKGIDKVFYWTGDTQMLLAIIKYVEDVKNVDNDIQRGVRVILVIEDSPKFFSMFLPIIYTEIMTQTRSLISEGVNDLHRMLRMRARPKILMAETYEQGRKLYKKYKDNLLGVISDVRFPRKGEIDKNAGFRFAGKMKRDFPDLPFLLQSSNEENRKKAYSMGLDFLHKNSQNLLFELQRFILSNFGFGDFVFKDSQGEEIGRASNISEFEEILHIIPQDILEMHASRNHFSIWLRARTEFDAADKLRPVEISDFDDAHGIRKFIIDEIQKISTRNQAGVIADFGHTTILYRNSFFRLGGGSLGGKARGIAFLNALLAKTQLANKFENVEILTPHTFVICTDVFDKFIRDNDLQEFAIMETRNETIAKRFLKKQLPEQIRKDLKTLLQNIHYPIAVRSSSLLEDSQMLPFAGLYQTFMLPNNSPNLRKRLKQLYDAVKLVFASVYYKSPKEYVRNTNFRTEEEKMSVIIQQVVGQEYNGKFYPVISGTAQSYNYYPISYMETGDGVVQLALGLGSIVAEGGQSYRVSPRYPEMNPPYSSAVEFMRKSQNVFYALNLTDENIKVTKDEYFSLKRCELSEAETDGSLFFVGSTFSGEDNAIRDTISIPGPRVITFANMLKYNLFPLAGILDEVLTIGRQSFGSHIEMEFAVNIFKDKQRKPEFYLLQVRPMVVGQEGIEVAMDEISPDELFCSSSHCMGHGVFDGLTDLVYVDPDTFDPANSRVIAAEVGDINERLANENRKYILIGFGRWGTSDPWLGIPVEWFQISNVEVLIESNLEGFNIEPSQGSHFFHNLTSLGLGYLHIKKNTSDEFIDWQWAKKQKNLAKTEFVKHIRLDNPFKVKINARTSQGVILKP
ncbi:MAG: phosphoenolpyruvate synthase [bacterium]|nr:phosphoenolpyruvate synthase [bacterium]